MGNVERRRTAWAELPGELHRTVAELLGGPDTGAVSQANGFSPGSADRVVSGAGRRAFVKANASHPGASLLLFLDDDRLSYLEVAPHGNDAFPELPSATLLTV
jgi:hypothetical protein